LAKAASKRKISINKRKHQSGKQRQAKASGISMAKGVANDGGAKIMAA